MLMLMMPVMMLMIVEYNCFTSLTGTVLCYRVRGILLIIIISVLLLCLGTGYTIYDGIIHTCMMHICGISMCYMTRVPYIMSVIM